MTLILSASSTSVSSSLLPSSILLPFSHSLSLSRIGELTVTKIKDSFAIFKNLVLEARANGGDGSGGGGSEMKQSTADNPTEETTQLLQQIKDLKSCLLQRDNEIAILVNMVKKERANATESSELRATREITSKESESEVSFPNIKPPVNRRNDGKSKANGSALVSTAEREALRSEKIIKKHLFGVPPPEDRALFEDMAGEKIASKQRIVTLTLTLTLSLVPFFPPSAFPFSPALCSASLFRIFPIEV
jgi:hypothetical protein